MIDVDDIDMRVRIDELRDAESLVGFQLACAVRKMNLLHATPDPKVAYLAESFIDVYSQRQRAERARKAQLA